jgi:hypothetical protein
MPLVALADGNAQTSPQSPVRECDAQCEAMLQQDLQRRAEEMRKKLERCIAEEIRSVDKELALERCADKAGAKLFKGRNSN